MKLALQPVRRDLATSYPLSFQSTAASLSSLFARRPLFSITCSLFSENTRGGGTPTNRSFGINNFQPLFSAPVCKAVTPAFNPAISPRLCAGACPDLVGGAIDLLPLCFHILTNCFSRNPFLFTIIRIAPGCGRPPSPLRRGDSSDVGSCVCRKGLRDGARLAKAYFFSTAFTSSMMSTPPAAAIPRMLRSLVRCSRSSGNFIQSSTYMLSSSEHRMTAITPTKTRNVRNIGATAFAAKLRPSYAGLLANTSGKASAVIPNEREEPLLRCCQRRQRAAAAVDDALAAENHDRVEERRRHRLAHDGHARGVDEQAGLHALRFGERAQRVVAGVVAPVRGRNRGQRFRQLGQQLRNFGIFPEFGFGRGIDLELIGEKRARPGGKMG